MLRRRMMRRLPAEYQEVEYLESTGVQWIDTGVQAKTTRFIDITFTTLIYHNDTTIFGGGVWTGGQYLFISQSNALRFYGGGTFILEYQANTTYRFITTTNKGYLYNISGTILSEQTIYLSNVNNFTLFANYNRGNRGWFRISNFKIIEDNENMLNFLPAYRISDHKPCMFDLVSQQPFFNQGSGADFLLGPNVYSN